MDACLNNIKLRPPEPGDLHICTGGSTKNNMLAPKYLGYSPTPPPAATVKGGIIERGLLRTCSTTRIRRCPRRMKLRSSPYSIGNRLSVWREEKYRPGVCIIGRLLAVNSSTRVNAAEERVPGRWRSSLKRTKQCSMHITYPHGCYLECKRGSVRFHCILCVYHGTKLPRPRVWLIHTANSLLQSPGENRVYLYCP